MDQANNRGQPIARTPRAQSLWPLWRSAQGVLILSVALFLGSACSRGGGGGDAELQAQAVAAHYGSSGPFTADLRIIAQPVNAEMLAFSVSMWAPSDGRIRLSCKKFNVGFLEAMVEADGSFTAVLVRDEAIVRGTLNDIAAAVSKGEAAGGGVFSELATINAVLQYGPLANASNWRWQQVEDGSSVLRGDLPGGQLWEASLRGLNVTHNYLRDAKGETLFSLRYTHEKEFERLLRAQASHLSVVGDDSSYLFRLQRFHAVPSIGDQSLALNVPAAWRAMSIDEFLQLLVAAE